MDGGVMVGGDDHGPRLSGFASANLQGGRVPDDGLCDGTTIGADGGW